MQKTFPSLFTPEHAMRFIQEEYSPFLFPQKINRKKKTVSVGIVLITEKRLKTVYDLANVRYDHQPPVVTPGSNKRLFTKIFSKPRCPVCSATLLSKIEYNMAISGGHSLSSMAGVLDDNKYCPYGWDTHGFWCAQHEKIHKDRCSHDFSALEGHSSVACPKCGDLMWDAVELVREVRENDS